MGGDTIAAILTQAFATKHVGTGKTLTASGAVTDGNSGNNYDVTLPATDTTGAITVRAITVTAARPIQGLRRNDEPATGMPTITSGTLAGTETGHLTPRPTTTRTRARARR